MARLVFLDSTPLGLAARRPGKPDSARCIAWLADLKAAGARIVIPEVCDHEVRREMVRTGSTVGLGRLDSLARPNIFLPVDRAAWLRAAGTWADLRNRGPPGAGPLALDADCILAGQVLEACGPGDVATVASGNVRHFQVTGLDAREWGPFRA